MLNSRRGGWEAAPGLAIMIATPFGRGRGDGGGLLAYAFYGAGSEAADEFMDRR